MEDPKGQFSTSNIHGLGAMRAPRRMRILIFQSEKKKKNTWEPRTIVGRTKHSLLIRKIIKKNSQCLLDFSSIHGKVQQ